MELDELVQALQGEWRVIASFRKQEAEHLLKAAQLAGKVVYLLRNQKSEPKKAFPENDYGVVVTKVTKNPKFAKKRRWKTESWIRYAIRISKWVGWAVDAKALQTAFELQEEA